MKRAIRILCISLIFTALLTGCSNASAEPESTAVNESKAQLPDTVSDSYYAGQSDPAFEYFHNSSIRRFFAMWVKEETGDLTEPQWYYDGFTKIEVMDHDFTAARPEQQLYCLPFSDGSGRYGYLIAEYDAAGPSVSNRGVAETTPYLYDLKSNMKEISASLAKTDIDLSTARASRVYLFDKEKKRADQVIRFTDDKGDNYVCYYGDFAFETEKWKALK